MTTTTTTASSMFSAYASFAGSMMLVRSMANQLIPDPIRSYLYSKLNYLFTPLSSNLTMIIDELSGAARNQVYDAAEVYLKTIAISPSTERLRVRKTSRQKSITVAMHKDEQLSDTFHNVKLTWRFKSIEATNGGSGGGRSNKKSAEKRHFELSFHKKHKDIVINSYLPHVLARADAIKEEQKVVKLYSRSLCSYDDDMTMISSWGSANMEHPSTFETMALDPEIKKMIMEDLERFVRRREFYKKAGKAWKRGYLLYGPPGTGKSSLIAAMANYLKYDVYDLELASIYSNHELRRVLLSTTNRSILVIEDIDCTVDLKNRKLKDKDYSQPGPNKLTLSGLLNFIDGLWSSCGDERIIVFTTNHKDRLDPALLRAGRMDVHIHLSYCTTSGFRILASNYLGIDGGGNNPHPLCGEIEGLIESAEVTPAEVAEELMKSDDADGALQGLVNFLKRKKVESKKTEDESEGSTEKAMRQKTDEGEETE